MTSAVYDDPQDGPTVLHFPCLVHGRRRDDLTTGAPSACAVRTRMILCDGVFVPRAPSACVGPGHMAPVLSLTITSAGTFARSAASRIASAGASYKQYDFLRSALRKEQHCIEHRR